LLYVGKRRKSGAAERRGVTNVLSLAMTLALRLERGKETRGKGAMVLPKAFAHSQGKERGR